MNWLEVGGVPVCFVFKQTLQVKEKQVANTRLGYRKENQMKDTSYMRHRQ